MKIKIFTLFIMLLAINTYAQVPRGFSAAAGVNSSMLNSKDLIADGAMGFTAGLGFNCGYHETYNYEFDILYSQNSLSIYHVDNDGANLGQQKFNMQTINFSGQVNYYFLKPDEGKFYLGAFAGLNLAFNTGGLTPAGGNTTDQYYLPYRLRESSFQNMSKFNYAPILGAVAGFNKFRLAVRYDLGLNNILNGVETEQVNENNLYTGPSLEGKMSSISVILYYHIF